MTKTLYLIRHAKSSWGNPGLRDHDRPLNNRGLHDAPKMALFLAENAAKPSLIITSTAKRALSTALYFADTFEIPEEKVRREAAIYEAHPTDVLKIIHQLPDTESCVLVFGHNPTFTSLANVFSEDMYIENVPTCGIVKITTTAESWNKMYEGNAKVVACYFPKEVL